MAIDKIINRITSGNAYMKASGAINRASAVFGVKYEKSGFKDVFEHYFEPKGFNNTFCVIACLMVFLAFVPRLLTAARRNPDNKEATRDEIQEILFRDVQTIGILLFLLKALNAVIAAGATKKTGLPMTNKPFEKVFDGSEKGILEKAKTLGKNIISAINPMGGVRAKTNQEHITYCSGYSFKNLSKLFNTVDSEYGDSSKVFNTVMDGTIRDYEEFLNGSQKKGKILGLFDFLKKGKNEVDTLPLDLSQSKINAQNTLEKLKDIKEQGKDALLNTKDKGVQSAIDSYFANENNSLSNKAVGLNGWLRLGALAMEASYLGFGIPTLNQIRLERKYLRNGGKNKTSNIDNSSASSLLIGKNIKASQVKLYHNFIK